MSYAYAIVCAGFFAAEAVVGAVAYLMRLSGPTGSTDEAGFVALIASVGALCAWLAATRDAVAARVLLLLAALGLSLMLAILVVPLVNAVFAVLAIVAAVREWRSAPSPSE